MKQKNLRFLKFKQALAEATGDKAILLYDDAVMIARNEFSPEQHFHSLQAAIDNFARYMPNELKEPTK